MGLTKPRAQIAVDLAHGYPDFRVFGWILQIRESMDGANRGLLSLDGGGLNSDGCRVGQEIRNGHGIGGQGANSNSFAVADELLHIRPVGTTLWWIRRYEDQKRITIINEMARLTKVGYKPEKTRAEVDIREAFMANELSVGVMKTLGSLGHTPESLRQEAFSKKRDEIMQLDQQIALQAKILTGFQGSYEVAFNRKLNIERLRLQNELMQRDLNAIDVVSLKDKALDVRAMKNDEATGHQSTKARRKSR